MFICDTVTQKSRSIYMKSIYKKHKYSRHSVIKMSFDLGLKMANPLWDKRL